MLLRCRHRQLCTVQADKAPFHPVSGHYGVGLFSKLVYAILLKLAEVLFTVSAQHEAGYICSMLFIIPGFPFITSGIDLAKLDMRSGLERLAYAILIILVATMTLGSWHCCYICSRCSSLP